LAASNSKTAAQRTDLRDWYSISVDTIRAWIIFVSVAVALTVGYFGYRAWEHSLMQREAATVLRETESLLDELRGEESLATYRREYASAQTGFQEARDHYRAGDHALALRGGRTSRNLLQWIRDALDQRSSVGHAQFLSLQGNVQYRRSESSEWSAARTRLALSYGDYVRTGGNGSAEIMFLNGTLYTVRPNTLFIISRSRTDGDGDGDIQAEQSINMEYGWVNLNTAAQPSTVTTPNAAAQVQGESEATVTYDQSAERARFVSYRGRLKIASQEGGEREVGPLQQVTQVRQALSSARGIPDRPVLADPPNNLQVSLDDLKQLGLSWEAVDGARRYALQVARNQLFVDNVIDVDNRSRTSATLGLQGEGTFQWRVAAIDELGTLGPWSTPRAFRVAGYGDSSDNDDKPPYLEVSEVQSYGSIFIVSGVTEPGAEMEVNDEPITVNSDGTFTKTVQLNEEGWRFLTLRARDNWGNEAVTRHRVFVEGY
jgi:hypothetical protein